MATSDRILITRWFGDVTYVDTRKPLVGDSNFGNADSRKEIHLEIVQLAKLSKDEQRLAKAAFEIRGKAYAPYSQFHVGAAILARDCGVIFDACNVEGADYPAGHAEWGAICGMIRRLGGDPRPYIEIAVVAVVAESDHHAVPCGGCRQRIREFGDDNTIILGVRLDRLGTPRDVERFTLGELLPYSFGPENLGH